ncbi:PREDICTED: L-2-hydroxyglutarate dehydrogenase, mitochondrial-like [Amphimedon queenslandica]|uniref:L-2-hydroxyglutarate dehydrogenase, mitochondrial n=1 Tax=Amphimedon queenslandica TaxID=400682 RepID=A0A1X7VLV1_AMPQE|nr:PREDICTED: L-2-hydroxyglutarate dehydrogenase, mitochondrial-like [Amphimedon queenslandica]|eukprot:XP_019864272.1 PREDICTED: L-2-hydroxyglutarate dehydrogenase, mitochondrial-like [Amphimedon queenslandica]
MAALRLGRLFAPSKQALKHCPLYKCTMSSYESNYDIMVIGGGIVGLATAREILLRYPEKKIAVLEKEREIGMHQSGHNSGVIHTGIYYTPGTLKAKLCVRGADLMYQYCDKRNIPYKRAGKVIVAVNENEIPRLKNLYERGLTNGVRDLKLIGPKELRQIEPYCKGVMAIHSPNTGIVDYTKVTESYAEEIKERKGTIYTGFEVTGFVKQNSDGSGKDSVGVQCYGRPTLSAHNVITCAGLFSDRMARMSGCSSEPAIVPFRGEYLVLKSDKSYLVNGNIYPVPDPQFPFLGVHFTPRMDGTIWLGPNAILAFAREGYKFTDFSFKDFQESMRFRGLRKLIAKNFKYGAQEVFKGAILTAQVKELQKYVPEIKSSDIQRGPAGVRAQAMDRDGNLIEDFIFDQGTSEIGSNMLHVRNAPSPAATSSLAIAEMIVDKAQDTFKWDKMP